jgi:hypothetical protein
MKQTITGCMFVDAFHNVGCGEQFSDNGLVALYQHLKYLEDEWGEELELDVITICRNYGEYGSLDEAMEDLGVTDRAVLDDSTYVIQVDGGRVIVGAFHPLH